MIAVMWKKLPKTWKPFHGSQYRRRLSLLTLLTLILIITILIFNRVRVKPSSSSFRDSGEKGVSFQTSVQFRPSQELVNGTELIWQIPESPKAVLFLAHGCNGRAANFWDKSPGCPDCVGLPEERLIVLRALHQKFAVLAISSHGLCWSLGKEKQPVKLIIYRWMEKHKLDKLPITALGASSGGYFVSALAREMKFSSITVMIAEGVFETDIPKNFPPTLFVHMPKDFKRMYLIQMNMEALRKKGVDVKEVKCMEFPLTPKLMSDRIPGLDETTSVQLFQLFRDRGFIDQNGYMRSDGRATPWKNAIRERKIILKNHELLHHIEEELNLAFGYHEMTSFQSDDIFDWFESHFS